MVAGVPCGTPGDAACFFGDLLNVNPHYRLQRNKLVAWLGILAMWLAVVAPVVSQTLKASAQEAFAAAQAWPLCTAHDAQHVHHETPAVTVEHASAMSDMPDMPGMDHMGSHGGAACAYCGFLADHLPVVALALTFLVGAAAPVLSVSSTPVLVFVAPHYDASRPRAPPFFAS